jgi:hypothetical protein
MAKKFDWMPQKHEELYSMANRTVAYFTSTVLARIGISGTAQTWYQNTFLVKFNVFKTAYVSWEDPAERTPRKTTILQEAENEFKPVYRKFYKGYIRENPLVTDDDLQGAGFPKHHSGGNTPARKPDTLIEMETETSKPAEITFHYHDAGSHGNAKPKGVHGMELVYRVRKASEPPATDWKELTTSVFSTRTPLTLTFTGDQRDMIVDYASRWENTRGEKGPWNTIQWVIIP